VNCVTTLIGDQDLKALGLVLGAMVERGDDLSWDVGSPGRHAPCVRGQVEGMKAAITRLGERHQAVSFAAYRISCGDWSVVVNKSNLGETHAELYDTCAALYEHGYAVWAAEIDEHRRTFHARIRATNEAARNQVLSTLGG
jgi:hypothetical protein